MITDLRLALRLLRRTPAATCIALLSIALSVGATAVVFTAIKSVLIDPLPYAKSSELVQLRVQIAGGGESLDDWMFWNDTQEIARRTRTLESVGIYRNAVFDLAGDPSTLPEALYGLRVSANLFPTLGVSPMLGRNLLPGEINTIILSYGLWARRFHSDRGVIGRAVKLDHEDYIVVGVMQSDFNFPMRRAAAHTPVPYVEFWASWPTGPFAKTGGIGAVARLRPNVSLGQAQQDLASISADLSREFPDTNRDRTLHMALLRDRIVRNAGNALWLLMGAALVFLLIGCANVANLLLARGFSRQREIAVRIAIGAGRSRIIRQLLTESCLLALLGGLGGYALTAAAWRILPALAPVTIPRLAAARADWPILAFALAIAVANGMLFGLAPALRAASTATSDFASRGAASAKHDRVRASLVIAEVAVTVTLVVIGGQLFGSFLGLLRTDPGFESNRVLASVILPEVERYPTPEQHARLYRQFLDAVRALPGVESAGTVDALPFSGENHGGFIGVTEAGAIDPKDRMVAEVDVVSADYLQTMGVRLKEGRWFHEEEMKPSSNTALVDDIAARRLWTAASAIGKRICVDCTPENPDNWKRIIGVVTSVPHMTLEGPALPSVYLSAGALEHADFLVVRTDRPNADFENAIRRAIAGVDPDQPVLLSVSMRTLIADSIADRRFILTLLSVTTGLALLMSMAGVYGVMSYITSRRTQEIGIRMALGATPGDVRTLIFGQGFLTAVTGLALGLGSAWMLLRYLRGMLTGLGSANPAEIWIAAGLVSFAAAAACWVPARRATRIDPMSALRED